MLKSPTYQIHWISQDLGGSPTREHNSRLLSTAVDLTLWMVLCVLSSATLHRGEHPGTSSLHRANTCQDADLVKFQKAAS